MVGFFVVFFTLHKCAISALYYKNKKRYIVVENLYVYSKNFYIGYGIIQSLAVSRSSNTIQTINSFETLLKKIEEESLSSMFIIIMDEDEDFCCVSLARACENKINITKRLNAIVFLQYTKSVPYPINILSYYGEVYKLNNNSKMGDFINCLLNNNRPLKLSERKKNKINISKYEKSIIDNMFDRLYSFKEMGQILNVVPGYVYGRRAAVQKKFGFYSTLHTQYFFEKFRVDDIRFLPFIHVK